MSDALDPVETTALGGAIEDRFTRQYALDHLTGDAFTSPLTDSIWRTVVDLHQAGRPVHPAAVIEALRCSPATLTAACRREPGLSDVEAVGVLRERAYRRRLVAAARRLAEDAADPSVPLPGLLRWSASSLGLAPLSLPDILPAAEAVLGPYAEMPHDWLMPGVLERRDRLMIVAVEGAGKSMILRMLAVQLAAGVHWCPNRPGDCEAGLGRYDAARWRVEPRKVLTIDAENSIRQIARASRRLLRIAEGCPGYDPANLKLLCETSLDLAAPGARDRIEGHLEVERPDLVVIGPIYKVFSHSERLGYEESAMRAAAILDDWRARYGFALLLEHHAGKGTDPSGERTLEPVGSSVWLRWNEFGRFLRRDKDTVDAYRFGTFRGDREPRDWPRWWWRNPLPGWPWLPSYSEEMVRPDPRVYEPQAPPVRQGGLGFRDPDDETF